MPVRSFALGLGWRPLCIRCRRRLAAAPVVQYEMVRFVDRPRPMSYRAASSSASGGVRRPSAAIEALEGLNIVEAGLARIPPCKARSETVFLRWQNKSTRHRFEGLRVSAVEFFRQYLVV